MNAHRANPTKPIEFEERIPLVVRMSSWRATMAAQPGSPANRANRRDDATHKRLMEMQTKAVAKSSLAPSEQQPTMQQQPFTNSPFVESPRTKLLRASESAAPPKEEDDFDDKHAAAVALQRLKEQQAINRKKLQQLQQQEQAQQPPPPPPPRLRAVKVAATSPQKKKFVQKSYAKPLDRSDAFENQLEREESELAKCTFKPSLDETPKAQEIRERVTAQRQRDLHAAGIAAKEKREQQARRVLEMRKTAELKNCTFTPNDSGKAAAKRRVNPERFWARQQAHKEEHEKLITSLKDAHHSSITSKTSTKNSEQQQQQGSRSPPPDEFFDYLNETQTASRLHARNRTAEENRARAEARSTDAAATTWRGPTDVHDEAEVSAATMRARLAARRLYEDAEARMERIDAMRKARGALAPGASHGGLDEDPEREERRATMARTAALRHVDRVIAYAASRAKSVRAPPPDLTARESPRGYDMKRGGNDDDADDDPDASLCLATLATIGECLRRLHVIRRYDPLSTFEESHGDGDDESIGGSGSVTSRSNSSHAKSPVALARMRKAWSAERTLVLKVVQLLRVASQDLLDPGDEVPTGLGGIHPEVLAMFLSALDESILDNNMTVGYQLYEQWNLPMSHPDLYDVIRHCRALRRRHRLPTTGKGSDSPAAKTAKLMPDPSKTTSRSFHPEARAAAARRRAAAAATIAAEREEEELRDCTFRPHINPPPVGTFARLRVSADQLYSRNEEVAARLEAARRTRQERELDGCTFAPKINDGSRVKARKDALATAVQVEAGASDGTPGGFDATIARMRAAREAREAKAKLLEPRSYAWGEGTQPRRLRVTQPRPPRLSTATRGSFTTATTSAAGVGGTASSRPAPRRLENEWDDPAIDPLELVQMFNELNAEAYADLYEPGEDGENYAENDLAFLLRADYGDAGAAETAE